MALKVELEVSRALLASQAVGVAEGIGRSVAAAVEDGNSGCGGKGYVRGRAGGGP